MRIHYPDGIEVQRPRTLWKDTLVGVAAGVVGTWAMERFTAALAEAQEELGDTEENSAPEEGESRPESAEREGALDDVAVVGPYHREEESAPETAGRVLHEKVVGRPPSREKRMELATRLHWAQGMTMGGLYGLFRGNRRDGLDVGGGLAFGAGVWLVADELAVPMLGLQQGPTAHPPSAHLKGLGAHLVYGVATAATTQLLEKL